MGTQCQRWRGLQEQQPVRLTSRQSATSAANFPVSSVMDLTLFSVS